MDLKYDKVALDTLINKYQKKLSAMNAGQIQGIIFNPVKYGPAIEYGSVKMPLNSDGKSYTVKHDHQRGSYKAGDSRPRGMVRRNIPDIRAHFRQQIKTHNITDLPKLKAAIIDTLLYGKALIIRDTPVDRGGLKDGWSVILPK